jgi:hypothetical protein
MGVMDRTRFVLCAVSLLAAGGCSAGKKEAKVYKMGEPAQVGSLVYTVLEADWLTHLSGPVDRIPKERFIVIRLTIQNAGSNDATVPLMTLDDSKGLEIREVDDLKNVPDTMPLLRIIPPGETMQGRIVFDGPTRDLRLRVSDVSDPSSEVSALIEVPMNLGDTQPLPIPNAPR